MKVLIVTEIDDSHMFKETNNLYDRLKDYKCKLIPVPEYDVDKNRYFDECEKTFEDGYNSCINDIIGED